jgi:hypothetical protein
VLELLLWTQNRKVEAGDLDACHLVADGCGTLSVGIAKRVMEAVSSRIGMTLNNGKSAWHRQRFQALRRFSVDVPHEAKSAVRSGSKSFN